MSFIDNTVNGKEGPLAHATRHKGTSEPLFDIDEVSKFIAREAISLAKESPKIMSELIEQTEESCKTLRQVTEGVGYCIENLKPMKKEMIGELRSLRMTATTEAAAMLKPLEEIRQFFLSDKHQEEVRRLNEFVTLCERLQSLKSSGFLDTVADTMLRLEG